ncbi:hypothetical protein M8C21_002590 [Ambrosia artemisiifolia]|uniref:Uncharacterized protein n=1 Tax=Ambrosia artemisiifolia TaxID=4212 RepID=A0AAD5BZH2_AMBAR|nr:hypothetical protein M8C21_002590 [Ambrosia artemisiifolia]
MSGDVENPKKESIPTSAPIEPETKWYSGLLQQVSVYGIAAGYCLSASLLSIINKWAVMKFPYPGALTALHELLLHANVDTAISATGFTVLGIVNKLLTVVINFMVWDKHSTFIGTIGLLVCMFGGVMYQQSTSNKPKPEVVKEVENAEEEQQKLLEMENLTVTESEEAK